MPVRRPDLRPVAFAGMVTVSPQMVELFERIRRVARSDATVLVRGASGTGKELVARALHAHSPRADHPLQAVNCASLTGDLLASELFGHVKGAFTGAIRDTPGLLATANGGTVFLDEVAEMPIDLQARLLRVLETHTFVPVGGTRATEVDVRLVSATNKSLRERVDAGAFREDLMYRIRVVLLFLPSLAQRTGDVEALTWHFVDELNRRGQRRVHAIDEDAMDALLAYPWPGNVRELRNNLEQAFVLGEGPAIRLDELARELQGLGPPADATTGTAPTLRSQERDRILQALAETGGRKGQAATLLGMSRSTLWRKIKEHGL